MIERITIQNFKSIDRVSVELSPVTVLVGRSGTGKSNFVQAVRCLRDLLTKGQIPNFAEYRPSFEFSGPTRFDIELRVPGYGKLRYMVAIPMANSPSPLAELLEYSGTTVFHQEMVPGSRGPKIEWITPPPLMNVIDPGPIAIDRLPTVEAAVVAFSALSAGVGCYSFPFDVMCRRERDDATLGLNDNASNYLNAFQSVATNLQDLSPRKRIVSVLSRVNQSIVAVELNNIQKPDNVVVGHRPPGYEKTFGFELARESEGVRRMLAHLLALYQRPSKLVMIFEHPEDGIHPGALSLLAEEFLAASEEGRGQVILTTHSPGLLNCFDVDSIRVVEMDELKTSISKLAPDQIESVKERLIEAGELLTVDPARSKVLGE